MRLSASVEYAEDGQSHAKQNAAVDAIHQHSDQNHGCQRAHSARAYRQAAVKRRVAQQRLQKKRQQGRDAVKHNAVEARDHGAHGEVAVSSARSCTIGSRAVSSRRMKPRNAATEAAVIQRDPGRTEPVRLLPLVEHQLHGAKPQRHQAESHGVDGHAQRVRRYGGSSMNKLAMNSASRPTGKLM